MTPQLIAITGFANSGKSTVADILVREHSYIREKFAAPLKNMLRAAGMSQDMLEGDLKTIPSPVWCDKSPRHVMQTLGTEWGRNMIGPDLWANLLYERAEQLMAEGYNVVVDDLRFVNEARVIKELKGTIWRVLRPGGGCESAHLSETEQLKIMPEYYLDNQGSIEDLSTTINDVIFLMEAKSGTRS